MSPAYESSLSHLEPCRRLKDIEAFGGSVSVRIISRLSSYAAEGVHTLGCSHNVNV